VYLFLVLPFFDAAKLGMNVSWVIIGSVLILAKTGKRCVFIPAFVKSSCATHVHLFLARSRYWLQKENLFSLFGAH
jgi:hypothetical protein